jgi:hypothetical protein
MAVGQYFGSKSRTKHAMQKYAEINEILKKNGYGESWKISLLKFLKAPRRAPYQPRQRSQLNWAESEEGFRDARDASRVDSDGLCQATSALWCTFNVHQFPGAVHLPCFSLFLRASVRFNNDWVHRFAVLSCFRLQALH